MKVGIFGSGRFGSVVRDELLAFRSIQVSVISHESAIATPALSGADVMFITASGVPPKLRQSLARQAAPISALWEVERKHNLTIMGRAVSLIKKVRPKIVFIATNPSHEWAAALARLNLPVLCYGIGSAFDNIRVKAFISAMLGEQADSSDRVRVLGGHGCPVVVSNGIASDAVCETAIWMSNASSVSLITAPEAVAVEWWRTTAVRPITQGLMGCSTRTHLIVPYEVDGLLSVSGVDVTLRGLKVAPDFPVTRAATERHSLHEFMKKTALTAQGLAAELAGCAS